MDSLGPQDQRDVTSHRSPKLDTQGRNCAPKSSRTHRGYYPKKFDFFFGMGFVYSLMFPSGLPVIRSRAMTVVEVEAAKFDIIITEIFSVEIRGICP